MGSSCLLPLLCYKHQRCAPFFHYSLVPERNGLMNVEILTQNRDSWNAIADSFFGVTALHGRSLHAV